MIRGNRHEIEKVVVELQTGNRCEKTTKAPRRRSVVAGIAGANPDRVKITQCKCFGHVDGLRRK
jgi:hypothetical protein